MNETTYIYVVHSDINENNIYSEFADRKAAIEYAERNIDELTYVDKVEVLLDDSGEIVEEFGSETIWVYSDACTDDAKDSEDFKTEEEYWDFLAAQHEEEELNKHDLGDTTWFESLDSLVETLEENEDLVECKECFELFPKADCIKLDIGYICPTCSDGGKLFTVSDDDTFKVDFPEYEKFNYENDMMPADTEKESTDGPSLITKEILDQVEPVGHNDPVGPEGEPGLTPEEAIPFLVKDEKEAIAGYEQAAAVVADSDVENKEEILDTIDHIKEEEEEHIEELTDLVDDEIIEVENDSISNEDEIETIEDPEPATLNEDTSSETRYWMCFYDGSDVAVIEATDEDEAGEIFVNDYSDEYFFDSWDHDWSVEEISKEEYDEWENSNSLFARLNLSEHVNKECPAIESDQELEGTDNAVVDCKVADVVTHSEDEKPVDCEGKKKPLEKPLAEGFAMKLDKDTEADYAEFNQLCKEIGIETVSDLDLFAKEEANREGSLLDKLRAYRTELGDDFEIKEKLNLTNGYPHIKSVASLVHDAVERYTKDNVVGVHKSGTAFYVLADRTTSDPEKMKKLILDTLAENGYDPDKVDFIDRKPLYGYLVDQIKMMAQMTLSHQKTESLTEDTVLATNKKGDYLIKNSSGYGYSVFSQHNVWLGGFGGDDDESAVKRFNCGDINESKKVVEEKFTPEEQEEYNMDEDGNSLDGYDEYVRCNWCKEIYTMDQCVFEANMGWLCDRCQAAITSRGEKLTTIINPTEEDIAKTLDEAVEMTADELIDKFGTDNVDLINAGRPEDERVSLKGMSLEDAEALFKN